MKKVVFFLIRVLIGCGILLALFRFVPYQKLTSLIHQADKTYIIAGFFCFLLAQVIAIFRWRYLLRKLEIDASLKESAYAFLSGFFFTLFVPSVVGTDVFRGSAIAYRHKNVNKSISSVVMDRFNGIVALNIICLVSFLVGRHLVPYKDIVYAVLIFSCSVGGLCLIVFSKSLYQAALCIIPIERIKKKIVELYEELHFFRDTISIFFKALWFSLGIQFLTCIYYYCVAKAFYVDVGFLYFLVLVPIISVISFVPVTIAGVGFRDGAAVYFLSKVGVTTSAALGVSLFVLSFFVIFAIIGGCVYVTIYHRWLESHLQNP